MEFENMNRLELTKLQKEIENRLVQVEKEDRKAALEAAENAARERGFSLEELTSDRTKSGKPKGPVKYRNRETGQEWSGRGRRPAWLSGIEDLSAYEV